VGHLRRLIVFDLDGTLIDSRQDLADSANALIIERGGRPLPDREIVRMVGEGAALLVRRALAAAGLPWDESSVARFLDLYDERLLRTTKPYAGVVDALAALADWAVIAVLTNKPIAPATRLIESLGLARFTRTVVGGDGPFPRKPDPSSLRHLMTAHHAAPAQTVLVGDSRVDFDTARAAGAHVCLARYGFGYEQFPLSQLTGDEGLVDEPAQIPAVVRALLPEPGRS
jgi:phosphoglycolate phosphatase